MTDTLSELSGALAFVGGWCEHIADAVPQEPVSP